MKLPLDSLGIDFEFFRVPTWSIEHENHAEEVMVQHTVWISLGKVCVMLFVRWEDRWDKHLGRYT